MSDRVTKIFGPPGTGKTTRLLRIVEEALASGMLPERIAYMAFTRKAADEAVARAKERFGFSDERLPWFRTLHSMAFHEAAARKDDIMQDEHFQELGKFLGYPFTSLDDTTLMPMGTALGDRVARIEALARLKSISLYDQWMESNFRDVPWEAVDQWSRGLIEYKRLRGMLDFTDLLESYNATLDVDLFIIDEAQDLAPLQWTVVKRAAATAKKIYLAGDDDQCIYGWAGADVNKFLRIKGTVEVLPHSYRLPTRVHHLASIITDNITIRQPKQWSSNGDRGKVDRIANEQLLDMRDGKWMLLSRNHCFLRRYEEVCKSSGYSYRKEDYHSTDTTAVKAIMAWEKWRKGQHLPPKEVKAIAKHLPELERWIPGEDTLLKESPLPAHFHKLTWMDALDIEPSYREYIRACLANKEPLLAEPRITVSTIHRVKGGEADHVVLITDLTQQPHTQLNTDEEQRVLYVAVTRARKSLTIVQPQSIRHYRI